MRRPHRRRTLIPVVASAEFGVPLPILMSVSSNGSLWEAHGGKPSFSGGYGC